MNQEEMRKLDAFVNSITQPYRDRLEVAEEIISAFVNDYESLEQYEELLNKAKKFLGKED